MITQTNENGLVLSLLFYVPSVYSKCGIVCFKLDDHRLQVGERELVIMNLCHSLLPILRVFVHKQYDHQSLTMVH